MTLILTEEEIAALLAERKPLPPDYQARIQARPERGHKERELEIQGDGGNDFRLVVRQSASNPFDFSVMLIFCPRDTSQTFRLCRYNGRSHEHTNTIEHQTFYDFHIHKATERYQALGTREDSYAEPTERFCDLAGALECLLGDCGFDRSNLQTTIFDEGATT